MSRVLASTSGSSARSRADTGGRLSEVVAIKSSRDVLSMKWLFRYEARWLERSMGSVHMDYALDMYTR